MCFIAALNKSRHKRQEICICATVRFIPCICIFKHDKVFFNYHVSDSEALFSMSWRSRYVLVTYFRRFGDVIKVGAIFGHVVRFV